MHSKISLKELHQKLDMHLKNQSEKWPSLIYAKEKGFYQGFDELEIDGWRPTEKRFEDYNIKSYLSLEKSVLDIGSNCGFFTLHSSKFVKKISGVEINPYLVSIADDAKNFLNINNSLFHNSSFEDFSTAEKFDIIFSLANDSTIDQNTKFNFLKNLTIFPMEELSKPKNFNENLNFKMSNMNMNIKIQYLKKNENFESPHWVDEKKLDNYMLPSFTKKIVKYLEKN